MESLGMPGVVRTGKRGAMSKEKLFRTIAVVVLASSTICLSTIGYALTRNKEKSRFQEEVRERTL